MTYIIGDVSILGFKTVNWPNVTSVSVTKNVLVSNSNHSAVRNLLEMFPRFSLRGKINCEAAIRIQVDSDCSDSVG